ncbi:MAG: phage major capsid protein [Clostridia bacterium]|nr:phage major capsid protein [Clostridia bacterium]
MTYENIRLEKSLYTTGKSFTQALESLDPSENYIGTELEGLDAFQRQLKRFDIKVSGKNSDCIEKFFRTSDSAALFPEYVSRAVMQGIEETDIVKSLVATTTLIDGLDYRSLLAVTPEGEVTVINEGTVIPETNIRTQQNLIPLFKRGRVITASYEAIRFQRLDVFTVALKQIGAAIARAQANDAINTLLNGDGNNNAIEIKTSDAPLSYENLVELWMSIHPYTMTTLVASPDTFSQIIRMPEFIESGASGSFVSTGKIYTPFGAELIRYDALPAGRLIAVDKNFALEKVQAGTVSTEFDKLIDRQLERAAVTSTVGFAKLFKEASVALQVNC